jgi:hypothetical protein
VSDSSGGAGDVLGTTFILLRLAFDGPLSNSSRSGDGVGDAFKAATIISLAVLAAALEDCRGFGSATLVGTSKSITRLVFESLCPSVSESEHSD